MAHYAPSDKEAQKISHRKLNDEQVYYEKKKQVSVPGVSENQLINRPNKRSQTKSIVEEARLKKLQKFAVPEGDNADTVKYLMEVCRLNARHPVNPKDPNSLWQRIAEYMQVCADNDRRPTFAALALSMGIGRNTLLQWARGASASMPKECVDVLETARTMLAANMEELMEAGKINPIAGIFLSRNNFGYVNDDNPDAFVTVKMEENSPEKIREKLNNLPD